MSFLAQNLAALAPHFPDLARQIDASPIPQGFSRVPGADNTPTFQRLLTTSAGTKRLEWLGSTSMPAASAPSIIKSLDVFSNGQNGLGLSIGTGFEWAAFCKRLGRAQLLYVYEPDLQALRMALEICDLAPLLATRRLILLSGDAQTAAETLGHFLDKQIGFEPPAVLHPLPTLLGERRNQFLTAGEIIVRHAVVCRQQLLAELTAKLQLLSPLNKAASITTLAFLLTPRYRLERPIQSELETRKATSVYLDDHQTASPVLRMQLLTDHLARGPVQILSDFFRPQLGPLPESVPVETWIPPLVGPAFWDRLPENSVTPADSVMVHSATHAQRLQDRGIASDQIKIRPFSPSTTLQVQPSSAALPAVRVAIIADLPASDAASLEIQLPTHQSVFAAARELILGDYLTIHAAMAPDVLRRALARAHVDAAIDDPALKGPMLRIIRDVLIPALPLLALAENLAREAVPLTLIGDWPNLHSPPNADLRQISFADVTPDTWKEIALLVHLSPQGIFSPYLLEAIQAGVPIIAPAHPAEKLAGSFPIELQPEKQFAHPQPQQLITRIKSLLRDEAGRQKFSCAVRQLFPAP